ncbi:MAG: alpha/beta fold hydrolase [Gammaproteobacteria bacterium]|nr:alpha/beta fold hydrolase [Gammaproteobacteria bacterium]
MRTLPLVPLLLALSCGAHAAGALTLEPYIFKANDGTQVAAEIGRLEVPERHGRDKGKTLSLRFVRFKSTSVKPGNPIVYLAGGPGGSGIDAARRQRFPLFMRLREVADVIAVDQRGTGLSDTTPECTPKTSYPLEKPLIEADFLAAMKAMAAECAAFWKAKGVDLDAYNTRENAADLAVLRQALGADKLNLWGISYGTHLALATAKYHPGIVDRLVLASSEGLAQTIKLPSRVDGMLDRLTERLAADREAVKKYPDFLGSMRRVHQRLDEQPVRLAVTDPRSGTPLQLGIGKLDVQLLASYLVKNPPEAASLPAIYAAMEAGHFEPVAEHLLGARSYFTRWSAMATAMDAASGISEPRWRQVGKEAETALLGRASNLPFPDINAALGVTDLGDGFREEVQSDIPALFFAGTLDGRTLLESQRELAAGFRHGRFVTVVNAGHDLLVSTPAVGALMIDFLKGKPVTTGKLELPPPTFR